MRASPLPDLAPPLAAHGWASTDVRRRACQPGGRVKRLRCRLASATQCGAGARQGCAVDLSDRSGPQLPVDASSCPSERSVGRVATAKAGGCDVKLLTAAVNGDVRAWDALVDRVLPHVWSVTADAELDDASAHDVSNVIFLRLAQRLHEFADAGEAVDWARRNAIEECRRARARQCAPALALPKRRRAARSSAIPLVLPPSGYASATCDAL